MAIFIGHTTPAPGPYDDRFPALTVLTASEGNRRAAAAFSPVMPIVLAEPDERWRHLAALQPGDPRRQPRWPAVLNRPAHIPGQRRPRPSSHDAFAQLPSAA